MQECALPVGLFSSVQVSRPHCVSRCVCVCVCRERSSLCRRPETSSSILPATSAPPRSRGCARCINRAVSCLHTQVGAIDVRKQISTDSNLHTTTLLFYYELSPSSTRSLYRPRPNSAASCKKLRVYSIAAEGCIFPVSPLDMRCMRFSGAKRTRASSARGSARTTNGGCKTTTAGSSNKEQVSLHEFYLVGGREGRGKDGALILRAR